MSASTAQRQTSVIRELNDKLRTQFIGGLIVLTASVDALPPEQKAKVINVVREFKDFTPDNNPHSENDMAFFEVDGERYFFKLDCYAPDMCNGSEAPWDPARTHRVLTIGEASDY